MCCQRHHASPTHCILAPLPEELRDSTIARCCCCLAPPGSRPTVRCSAYRRYLEARPLSCRKHCWFPERRFHHWSEFVPFRPRRRPCCKQYRPDGQTTDRSDSRGRRIEDTRSCSSDRRGVGDPFPQGPPPQWSVPRARRGLEPGVRRGARGASSRRQDPRAGMQPQVGLACQPSAGAKERQPQSDSRPSLRACL